MSVPDVSGCGGILLRRRLFLDFGTYSTCSCS